MGTRFFTSLLAQLCLLRPKAGALVAIATSSNFYRRPLLQKHNTTMFLLERVGFEERQRWSVDSGVHARSERFVICCQDYGLKLIGREGAGLLIHEPGILIMVNKQVGKKYETKCQDKNIAYGFSPNAEFFFVPL